MSAHRVLQLYTARLQVSFKGVRPDFPQILIYFFFNINSIFNFQLFFFFSIFLFKFFNFSLNFF